jgi:thiamine-phosphate pyrophosphorylase
MRLVVISPPTLANPNELQVLNGLLRTDVSTYHLRKPGCTPENMEACISAIEPSLRSKVVVHQHHSLATKYGLKVCSRSCAAPVSSSILCPNHALWTRQGIHYPEWMRPPGPLPDTLCSQSTSFHSLADLACRDWGGLDYAFLSPIYDSISKEGYASAGFDQQQLRLALGACAVPIVALGGITKGRITEARDLGFAGVAVLGTVWQAEDPIAAARELQALVDACR